MRKKIYIAASLALVVMLAGCSAPGLSARNVEDLLRAPQTDAQQNAVQRALNAYLGETLQLKYPRGGKEMTPFIIKDFDGDGQNEAAVLYSTTGKGKNVHLAMLENTNGTWEVVYEIEGLSTEVECVEVADIDADGSSRIIVGYANSTLSDKYLAVYSYKDDTVTSLMGQAYSKYILCELNDDGKKQLLLITPGAPMLQLIASDAGKLSTLQTVTLDDRFTECVTLKCGKSASGTGVVIDGRLDSSGLASQFLLWESGKLLSWPSAEKADVFALSRRFQPELLSIDIDDNGSVDIPQIDKQISTLSTSRRFYYISWHDYLLPNPQKRFGIYDALYGYFVRLPKGWDEKVSLLDDTTANGNWQMRSQDGATLYLSARIVSKTSSPGAYTEAADIGENRLMMYFGEGATIYDKSSILSGITVLK
ncbi:MAG: hypothetical protein RSC38_06365 [Oscillospiraceae bacterium]